MYSGIAVAKNEDAGLLSRYTRTILMGNFFFSMLSSFLLSHEFYFYLIDWLIEYLYTVGMGEKKQSELSGFWDKLSV
jgi:hypothetical protein